MGIKDVFRFGPPKDDDAATSGSKKSGAQQDDQPISEQHGWTNGPNMATKVTVGLLWVALAAGPLALGMRFLVPPQQLVVPTSSQADQAGEIAAVSEFATRAIVLWLETPNNGDDQPIVEAMFPSIEQIRPATPWTTDNVVVANVEKLENQLWAVTVAADVTDAMPRPVTDEEGNIVEPDEDDLPKPRRMYFQVPIVHVNGSSYAQALPAIVPAPDLAEIQDMPYRTNVGSSHPVYRGVQEFLSALLTSGNNESLERLTSPGSDLDAIIPAPYASVAITQLQSATKVAVENETPTDGDQLEVLATVRLVGTNEQSLTAQYAIRLVARQERWEIAEIHDSPELVQPVQTPTAPPPRNNGGGNPPPDDQPDETEEPDEQSTGTGEPEPDPTGDGTDSPEEPTGTEPPATEPPADPPTDAPPAEGADGQTDPAGGDDGSTTG